MAPPSWLRFAVKVDRATVTAPSAQIAPPSPEALAVRLAGRGTETAEELVTRAKSAIIEMERSKEYDHLVLNETGYPEEAAAQVEKIVLAERARHPERRIEV